MPKEMKEEFKKYSDSREYLYASELSFARRHKAENFIAWLDWREGYLTAVEAEREAGLKYCSDTERMLTIEGDTMPSQASVANMLWELIRSRSK